MAKTSTSAHQNGGFPEPPLSEPVKIVSAVHEACGLPTGCRLPLAVPSRAVRRMHCATCDLDFNTEQVDELGTIEPQARQAVAAAVAALPGAKGGPRTKPSFSLPKRPSFNPRGRVWQLASLPLAAVAVVSTLALLQGGGEQSPATEAELQSDVSTELAADPPEIPAAPANDDDGDSKASRKTEMVRGSTYSLALPAGWKRVAPVGGATFAAAAPEGAADVQLWIDEDPKLDFPTFISQSMTQLEALTGSARVIERIPASTPEATVVRLAADAPAGQPSYEVTLRVAGPYRYYLAGSVQPDASSEAREGADLVAGSFTPELGS